jgi:hypothetical protein
MAEVRVHKDFYPQNLKERDHLLALGVREENIELGYKRIRFEDKDFIHMAQGMVQ